MSVVVGAYDRVKNLVTESVVDNPVVTREFRTRMRGSKAFMVMGGYVLFIAGIQFIAYVNLWSERASGANSGLMLVDRNVGMELFLYLSWTQAILLSLIIPSLTFSSLTQEIERKTMEMLALTRLTPGKIVVGKQLAGFLYALVLLICSVPLAGMCLMFGGISPAEIGLWYLVLAAWCFLLTCLGVFWSSLFTKTAAAALFAYGTTVVYFLATLPFGVITVAPFFGPSSNAHVLGALNPGWAAYTVALSGEVCGVKVPLWIAAVGLHVLLGALLLLIASAHVKHHRAERTLSIRILLMIVTAVPVWLLVGNLNAMGGPPSSAQSMLDLIGVVSGLILGFVGLFVCSVATGEVRRKPGQSVLAYALSVRKVFKGDLGGAITFMLVWTASTYAAFAGTFVWLMKSQATAIPVEVWRSLWQVGVSLLAIVMGIAALGVLASCCVKQRRNAAALVLLFLILIFSGYLVVLAYYVDGISNANKPLWQLAAFWPMTPILASTGGWRHMPRLWWSSGDSWIVSSLAYVGIAALCLALATRAASAYGGVKEE